MLRYIYKYNFPSILLWKIEVSSFKSFINLLISLLREILFKFLYLNPVAPYGLAKRAMKKYLLNSQQLYDLGQKYLQLTFDGIIDPSNSYWKENLNHIFYLC